MNIKRWLPLLLLMTILGGGVYWLDMDAGEKKKPTSKLKASDEHAQIFNSIASLKLNPSNVFGDVKALLDSIETSKLNQIEQDQLIEKLGEKAVKLFDQRFNAWVSYGFGSVPLEAEYAELRNIIGQLGLKSDGIGELQREFPTYAQAFVLYKLYFEPGAPDELIARLNRMRKRPYKPQRYQELLTAFNSNTHLLEGLAPVRAARNQIEMQRQCHDLVDWHYAELVDSSEFDTDNYNKNILPPGVNVQKSFSCGARSYGISDFEYYYKQGRNLYIWKQAIW